MIVAGSTGGYAGKCRLHITHSRRLCRRRRSHNALAHPLHALGIIRPCLVIDCACGLICSAIKQNGLSCRIEHQGGSRNRAWLNVPCQIRACTEARRQYEMIAIRDRRDLVKTIEDKDIVARSQSRCETVSGHPGERCTIDTCDAVDRRDIDEVIRRGATGLLLCLSQGSGAAVAKHRVVCGAAAIIEQHVVCIVKRHHGPDFARGEMYGKMPGPRIRRKGRNSRSYDRGPDRSRGMTVEIIRPSVSAQGSSGPGASSLLRRPRCM